MSFENAIEVSGLGKSYYMYATPEDRLKQMIVPKLQKLLGRPQDCYFREFWALRDVSFSVRRGETVGIIGRNGSGKSTLLQMICGTLTPTLGTIKTAGRIAALLELGAGFNPEFTGRQNAILNAQILGLSAREIEDKIDEIEAFADIGDFFERPVRTYSSGMYVRVAFAVQAVVDPEILVVDEALGVGDAAFQAKCLARINRLKERGTSILFVSHDVSSVRQLCDRAIWLHEGRTVVQGDTAEVTGNYMKFVFSDAEEATTQHGSASIEPLKQYGSPASQTHGRVNGAGLAEAGPAAVSNGAMRNKPVSHWGSDVGCILGCELQDRQGNRLDCVTGLMPIQVWIRFKMPRLARFEGLGAACAIRLLNGIDVMTSNTFDRRKIRFETDDGIHEVLFYFDNFLNAGEYMLVGVIEDRSEETPRYYEFIEGAQYFKVVHEEVYFGQCIVPVEQVHREIKPVI